MTGATEWPLPPPAPVRFTLTSAVVLLVRLRRKTSTNLPPSSFVDRLLAELRKRTKRPSALMTEAEESLFPPPAGGIEGSASDTACTGESARPLTAAAKILPKIAHKIIFVCHFLIDASLLLESLSSGLIYMLIYMQKFVLF